MQGFSELRPDTGPLAANPTPVFLHLVLQAAIVINGCFTWFNRLSPLERGDRVCGRQEVLPRVSVT